MAAGRWILCLIGFPLIVSIAGDEFARRSLGPGSSPTAAAASDGYEPREGDIVFQSIPHTWTGFYQVLEGITQTPFTNCGIVTKRVDADGERWVVIEAYYDVTETDLNRFIGRGRDRAYVVFRPAEEFAAKLSDFAAAARRHVGKKEDVHFRFDDRELYPAELAFRAFLEATGTRLGDTCRFRDLNWRPYEAKLKAIAGGELPLDNEMTTLKLIGEAPQLREFFRVRM